MISMKQLSRFVAVGLFNTVLGYFVIFGCMYLVKISPEISNVAGYAVGLVASYILNRKYTFNSKQNQLNEIVRFLAVFFVAYASNFVVLIILIHGVGVHEGASQILAGLIYVIASFIMNKYYVFKAPNVNAAREV
jgi:putative flippase GtrA